LWSFRHKLSVNTMMGIKMMLSPLALGFAAGFLLSIPPDSGSLEAINRGIHRGFLSSFLVGLGGIIGDTLCYGALILGFTFYIEKYPFLKLYTILACFAFLFLVGLYYLLGNRVDRRTWVAEKARYVVFWFRNPILFGLASSLLTPTTLILTAPFCGILIGRVGILEVVELLAGFVLGGILWSALLALLSAGVGRKMGFHFKSIFRKTAGLFYILTGLAGIYLILMEMSRA